ncbi:squalene/phytoene synthase family protein [Streptomyces cylindrosporus]|uniref:Squalene/phytoene synthase family protein n=1 Tax=Streptomyces cylindrosporus TaxID=2927583 RepID=A0ABS9Y6K6_9ACTN|nr:squalene/phytoene synthase family protein [Streptomyces cylindrosporus]MCI3272829.1 squalene/phytoene synthase family protein [Streptomyces cylindrosporus]
MSTWGRSLTAAGIREPRLRDDYTRGRRLVSRFRRSSYLAARLLLPPPTLPHVVAATAFMHHGDNLLDTGPKRQRIEAWASWEQRVRKALARGTADEPLIRALLHTVTAYPRLHGTVEEYLATAHTDLDFTGFVSEADFQSYVDAYSLPSFMLVATLLGPERDDDGRYRAMCRTLMAGSQRLDFVNDLAEDTAEGRPGIPSETLERFSLTPADLTPGHDSPGLRELLTHEIETARTDLRRAQELGARLPPLNQSLLRAFTEIELRTADAALTHGPALLHGPARPPLLATLRILHRQRRH